VVASTPVSIRVNALPSAALTAPASGTVVQPPGSVNLTAAASDSDGSIAKVELYRGAALIATLMSPPYAFTDSGLAPATYSYSARAYDNDGGSTGTATVSVVVNALPSVSITAPGSGVILPPPGSVALTISAADSDGSVAKVEIYRGLQLIATLSTPPYTFIDSGLASGFYSYTAKAYDNTGGTATSAAVDVRINAVPVAAITEPADGSFAEPPGTFTVSATAGDSDGTVSRVELYRNATLIGTFAAAPYTFTERNLPAATYVYTAKAYDNDSGVGVSAPITMTVSHNLAPSVAIAAPASGTILQAPAAFTLSAAAADSDGSIAKLEFYRTGTLIGTATSAPYSIDLAGVGPGTYTYSAIATDNRGGATASDPITVVVNAQPTVVLSSPSNNSTISSGTTLTLIASAADSDGSVIRVEFYNGARLLGQASTAPYQLSLPNLRAAPYAFYARAVDNGGGAALSAPVYVTVSGNAAPTTVNYQYDELGRLIGIQPQ
jgi:hypothetical protein